jgi:hypothetical protein
MRLCLVLVLSYLGAVFVFVSCLDLSVSVSVSVLILTRLVLFKSFHHNTLKLEAAKGGDDESSAQTEDAV